VLDSLFPFLTSITTFSQAATGSEETDFVINQLIFFLALIASLATTAGIGIKVASYVKKKATEQSMRAQQAIEEKITKQSETIKGYVDHIVTSARERRDRQDYVIENLLKRMDGLEEQQQMQMQIVLQNQQNITDFLTSQKKGPGRPKKDVLPTTDS
jgi:TolA-binding protein